MKVGDEALVTLVITDAGNTSTAVGDRFTIKLTRMSRIGTEMYYLEEGGKVAWVFAIPYTELTKELC